MACGVWRVAGQVRLIRTHLRHRGGTCHHQQEVTCHHHVPLHNWLWCVNSVVWCVVGGVVRRGVVWYACVCVCIHVLWCRCGVCVGHDHASSLYITHFINKHDGNC